MYKNTDDKFGDLMFLMMLGLVVSRRATVVIEMNLHFMEVND